MTDTRKPPITVKIPPKQQHKAKDFDYWWGKLVKSYGDTNPGLVQFKQEILTAARQHHIGDAIYLAAVLLQSGGIHNVAHIEQVATALETGSKDLRGFVEGAKAYIPKGYNTHINPTIQQNVDRSLRTSTVKADRTDPYVFKDKYGTQYRKSQFTDAWQNYNAAFQQYLGRNATQGEVKMLLDKRWGDYKIRQWLTTRPAFTKGPLWKSQAGAWRAAWNSVYGDDPTLRPPKDLIRKAIAQNWDSQTFMQYIRHLPEYQRSPEYGTNVAAFTSAYQAIYGQPDDQGKQLIAAAVAKYGALDPSEARIKFEAELRARPEYKQSLEYRGGLRSLADTFGVQLPAFQPPGKPATGVGGTAPPPPPPVTQPPVTGEPPESPLTPRPINQPPVRY